MMSFPLILSFGLAPSARADDFADALRAYLGTVSAFQAQEPIRAGLPAEIAATIKEDEGYLDFPGAEGAPVWGDDVRLDGRAPTDEQMAQVLSDDHGLRLPQGQRIKRLAPGTPKEFWDHPVGTRFLHRFLLRTNPPTLTEIRLIEKQRNGKWAFGVYILKGGGKLRLMKKQESVSLAVAWQGRNVELSMTRLHPESCRGCHQMHSPVNDYPEQDFAGPCGFGPGNKKLAGWAEDFKTKRGYDPFAN